MRPIAILLTFAAIVAPAGVCAEPLLPIFDARVEAVTVQPSAAEAALLERVVRVQARAAWTGADSCSDEFAVLARAAGAFTRPGATQSAVLYRFCNQGRQIGMSGVAVLEGGRVAAHVVFKGGGEYAIAALPDVDENGLSGIAVVELGPSGVKKLGTFVTSRSNCGSGERGLAERASVLYATPGATPRFLAEDFTKACDAPARWRAASARVTVLPDKDDTMYRRLL
jgi:hypothetical protein